jgi:two-component system OmpR family sensor kinase
MTERLQKLVASQQRLLHDVSHELRSPLARLHAAIGLARQSPERHDTMLERIEREAGRLDALVGELLALSRLEAGAAEGPAQPVAIAEMLEELAEDARFEARALGRDLVLSTPGDARGTLLSARPEWLQRAFENVVRNAIRHTGPGTAVEIALTYGRPGELVVSVADRGPGVAGDELETIFDPFQRGRASASSGDGHGLGLAIARRAITAHRGTISAANRPGGGLVVTVALPIEATGGSIDLVENSTKNPR